MKLLRGLTIRQTTVGVLWHAEEIDTKILITSGMHGSFTYSMGNFYNVFTHYIKGELSWQQNGSARKASHN